MALADIPDVCFIADVCKHCRVSLSVVKRLRSCGTFPIPELPRLDDRPRWSGRRVREFIADESNLKLLRRRVG